MLVELPQVLRRHKIDKPVSHIALVLDITRQVEKVIGVLKAIVNLIRQFLDGILVRNVSDHYRCPGVVLDVGRHDHIEIPLFVWLVVAVVVVIALTAVVAGLEEVEVRMDVDGACVTFRKGRVD